MNDKNIRTYDMFGLVSTFGRDNAADFPAGSQTAATFARLAVVMLEIDQGHTDKKVSRTSVKKAKLDKLRVEMRNLAATAREIDKKEPGVAAEFRLPTIPSQAALLANGRKMVEELKTQGMLARFTAFEVSANIVAELETLIGEIEVEKDECESGDVEGVENTASINLAIEKGKYLVDSLSAAIQNKYKNNPAKLAAWATASHIERAPKRKKAEAPKTAVSAS